MRIRNVAIAGALVLTLAACGDDGPSEVSGIRDDVRKVSAVKEKSHQERTSSTKCTRRVKGKCKSSETTKGWKKVVDRHAKPARYCVELDDVNGDAGKDDVWYTVGQTDYNKASLKDEGDAVKFTPLHSGC